jgi:DNA-binding CsgD family transcriptional regulator
MLHFGGKTAMLGFIRGSDADFSAADLRAVSAIGGHLEASLSLAERTSPPSDVSTLVAAYEETGATALFLSGRRRVIATTKAASTLIGDEVALIDGRLTFRSAGNQAAYEELLAEPPDAGSIKRMTLGDTASLLVHASSLADGGTKGPGSIETVLSFVSLEPTADEVARVETALIGMSLAPAEARVAAVVGSGAAPAEAASTLALTELTVRSYLKRAYWKLGITRQSELVLLCGRIRHL